MCPRCGHDVGSSTCCQLQATKRTYAQVVGLGRTGERPRQEASRDAKDRRKLEDDALLRPRMIPTVEEATTPAARRMAAMAAKFRKKE